jgi:hypothetical protein
MFRRLLPAVFGALLLGLSAAAQAQSNTSTLLHESDNPINDQGSSYDYRSEITDVTPAVRGLRLEVLEFADRLSLTNRTGRTVTVYGYQGEPYARVLANGAVEVNTRSPAYFLNQSFYGAVTVPRTASPSAPPQWTLVDRTGQLEWHDHRIHWMSPALPPQVKDKGKRTKIFDWRVPIRVGGEAGNIQGRLFWVPEEGTKAPLAAIVALIAVLLAALGAVLFVRRRRRRRRGGPPDGPGGGERSSRTADGGTERPVKEAW